MSEPAALLPAVVPGPGHDLERLTRVVLAGVSCENTRRAYARALDDFLRWYAAAPREAFSRFLVQDYRSTLEARGLASSTVNIQLSALRKLAREAAALGFLANEAAAGIGQVKGARKLGVRAGNWLTREQATALLRAPDPETLKGKRDRAILAVLVGCGLRRAELIALDLDSIEQRDGRWVIVDLIGKGKRVRTVPVPAWVKRAVDQWTEAAAISAGRLFRPINKGGTLWGNGITAKVIWWIVLEYARPLGLKKLAPHDLRRTCAKLCRSSGGDLEQIQLLLGHASVQTTEQYLGTRQNLIEAVNDRMGLDL